MLAFKIIAGVLAGGALGLLLGRARVCGTTQCNVKINLIASILAGAVFGAAVAFYFATR